MISMPSTDTVPHTPPLNALKHGLRSPATLLPGDSRPAFDALRGELFHLYQPRTVDEAFCVSQMAKLQWRIRRCDRWQEIYDDQQDALLCGDPGLESALCEPDAHRSLHRPMDCELHAGRMDRRLCRLRARLFELQRLRRLGLIAGKEGIVEDYRILLAAEVEATASEDRGKRECSERTEGEMRGHSALPSGTAALLPSQARGGTTESEVVGPLACKGTCFLVEPLPEAPKALAEGSAEVSTRSQTPVDTNCRSGTLASLVSVPI